MPNRYANLVGSNKIKDEWSKINTGFDKVQVDLDNLPFNVYRQALINGNFDVWQRGTSFNLGFGYGPDRWYYSVVATSVTGTISRQAFSPGQTDVPNNPKYFMRVNPTALSGCTFFAVGQRIEGVEKFAGMKATLSFWAKADAARTIGINLDQVFGGGGSSAAFNFIGNASLTTDWKRFTMTVTLPSISGKVVGTSDYLNLVMNLPTSTTFVIDIAQVQINAGDVAQPYMPRAFAEELMLCQRYYERWDHAEGRINFVGIVESSTAVRAPLHFKVKKRVAPTMSQGGTFRFLPGGTGTTISFIEPTPQQVVLNCSAPGYTILNSYIVQSQDTGGWIASDAEL